MPVGADGRYRLSGVPDGRFVKIESVDLTGIRDPNRYRQCATNTIIRDDTQLDVELLLPGTPVPGPTLSGQVYTMDAASRVPLARATMYFRSRGFGPDTWAVTDEAGRYSLCGIPPMPAIVYMVCGNGETAFKKAVDVRADTGPGCRRHGVAPCL